MYKITLLSVFILICVFSSQAQQVINADKNYASPLKSSVVSITAVAILNGKPEVNDINRENYHRAVSVADDSRENVLRPPIVEIITAAQNPNFSAGNTVQKEAIMITPENQTAVKKATPAIIERSVPAVKQ